VERDVCHGLQREEDGGVGTMVQWAREEEERTKRQGVGGGCKIEGEEGLGCRWGALCLTSLGGTCSWRGAADDHYCGGDNGYGEGGCTEKKLADLANMRRKETREDSDKANKRGGQSPVRCSGNSNCGVTQG
jgi:hypothetical protein